MLDNIKHLICLKSVDKNILENNFDVALEKLNFLIQEDFQPSETLLKRGKLCKKLLMYNDAYADFTYIINHCAKKQEAYFERAFLNYEISNFYEAIHDVNVVLGWEKNNFELYRIKILSYIYSKQDDLAIECIFKNFDNNKYKVIQFLFNEVARVLAKDEFTKGLRILEIIDLIDKDNPIKLLKEANIYGLLGKIEIQQQLLEKIEKIFPKYFISRFKFMDIYQDKDIMEVAFLLELSIFDKQGLFLYPFKILEGYKYQLENHIIDSKECFESAIRLNPYKPEGYVLLGQTLQLMSGYDNANLKDEAINNYQKAMEIYQEENLPAKVEEMKRQIKHLNSTLVIS
ncbi:MAG: hypothetical protein Q4E83_06365 [bacterium]|nr:hypothetical protein [bacterium]